VRTFCAAKIVIPLEREEGGRENRSPEGERGLPSTRRKKRKERTKSREGGKKEGQGSFFHPKGERAPLDLKEVSREGSKPPPEEIRKSLFVAQEKEGERSNLGGKKRIGPSFCPEEKNPNH